MLAALIVAYRRRSQQLEQARRGVDGTIQYSSPMCGLHNYHIAHYADAELAGMPAPAPGSAKSAAGGSAATSPGGDPGYASCPTTENDYFQTWQLQRHAAMHCTTGTPSRRGANLPHSQRPVVGMLPLGVDTGQQQHHSGRPHVEHIYESPKFERRDFIPPPPPTTTSSVSSAPHPAGGASQQRAARECVCCAPPPVSRPCVQYIDTELNAPSTTAAPARV